MGARRDVNGVGRRQGGECREYDGTRHTSRAVMFKFREDDVWSYVLRCSSLTLCHVPYAMSPAHFDLCSNNALHFWREMSHL